LAVHFYRRQPVPTERFSRLIPLPVCIYDLWVCSMPEPSWYAVETQL